MQKARKIVPETSLILAPAPNDVKVVDWFRTREIRYLFEIKNIFLPPTERSKKTTIEQAPKSIAERDPNDNEAERESVEESKEEEEEEGKLQM